MQDNKWMLLQLFAGEGAAGGTGAGDGGGEAPATGVSDADAGYQRLRELGVPEDKIRKRAKKPAVSLPEGAVRTAAEPAQTKQAQEQAAAVQQPTEEKPAETPPRMSWDDIVKDPEYNQQIQKMMQDRVRKSKVAEDNMSKLAPALEILAKRHNMDAANLDYEALASAISNDDAYYEGKAVELGVPTETVKKTEQQAAQAAIDQRKQNENLQDQMLQQHHNSLLRQAEDMKKVFPNFDLSKELQNPTFLRMTAPNSGLSVEDAYYAVHRKEIQAMSTQVTAHVTAEKISNAIASGTNRPQENGTSAQAPSVTTFDYSKASAEQRNAIKAAIRQAAARGEKLYPGTFRKEK